MCFCKFLSERKNIAEQEFLLAVLSCVWCLAEGHLQRPVLNLSRGGLCLGPGSPQLLQASPWSVLPSDQPKERSRIFPESADCYCWMCAGTLCPHTITRGCEGLRMLAPIPGEGAQTTPTEGTNTRLCQHPLSGCHLGLGLVKQLRWMYLQSTYQNCFIWNEFSHLWGGDLRPKGLRYLQGLNRSAKLMNSLN